MQKFTLAEIQKCGPQEERIMLSILGLAYDVSSGREFFGPRGPYRVYSGHDATWGLATMSLAKTGVVDVFHYELDGYDLQTLADWISYFDVKYGRVGLVTDVTHPVRLEDLPTGKDPSKLIAMSHPALDGTEEGEKAFDSAVASMSQDPVVQVTERQEAERQGADPQQLGGRAAPSEKLSRWLIEETSDLHEQALRGHLMQAMMQRKVGVREYAEWVAALFSVYTELEFQLQEHAADPLVAQVDDVRLRRLSSLEADLRHFYGPKWASLLPSPSLFTIRYVSRISDVADQPHRLLVHHWMRYGGGLAGGQFLKVALRAGLKLKPQDGVIKGVQYHTFDKLGDIQTYYESYLLKLDKLCITEKMWEEMKEEARIAFDLNIKLNDEIGSQIQARL
jgi:heme oxygenase